MLSFLDSVPYGTPQIRRTGFWLTLALAVYSLFGFLAAPPLVKHILTTQLTENLHRTARIGSVSFNPLTLDLRIRQLAVDKKEAEGQFVSIDQLDVSPGLSSIWRLAPVISELKINGLMIDVAFLGNGTYSFSDLAGAKGQDPSATDSNATEGSAIFPFALYDFEMANATIVFDDQPRGKKHVISDLYLSVPFTSSFIGLSKKFTQPTFSAVVNGDPIRIKGRTLPFDKTLRTEFELGAVEVDLHQYWQYVPLETPLELVKGRFSSDLSLIFERPDDRTIHLFLGGGGKLTDMALKTPEDGQVLAFKELSFAMEKYSLGDNLLVLTDVTMDSPFFRIIRHKAGDINWGGYFPGSRMEPPGPKVKAPAKDEASLLLDIRSLNVKSGTLDWEDRAVPDGFRRTYKQFEFSGREISTVGDRPSTFTASAGAQAKLVLKGVGTVKPLGAQFSVTGSDLELSAYKTYFNEYLPLETTSGTAGLTADVEFKMIEDHPQLNIRNGTLSLDNLALTKQGGQTPSVGLNSLRVSDSTFDLREKNLTVGSVVFSHPFARLVHGKDGVDLINLFSEKEDTPHPVKPPTQPNIEPVKQPTGKPWETTVKSIRVKDAALTYTNDSLKHPANLTFDGLKLDIDNLTTRPGETMTYNLESKGATHGTLSIAGSAGLDTLSTKGRFKLNGLALRPLDGHLGTFTELLFASGSASADVQYTVKMDKDTPSIKAYGTTALNKVRFKDNQGDGEFASFDKLALASVAFLTNPYRLSIGEIRLDKPSVSVDFDDKGHSNIRRAFRIPEPPPLPEGGETETQKAEAQTAPKPKAEKSIFDTLDIGVIKLTQGHVRFRDASVKPTYYTELSDINFDLIQVNQTQGSHPKMDLRAKIGPTPISIIGVFNPVIHPMYSDLALSVNGMELASLSPYTIKYLAYPVEKGQLYADVKFRTENWELDADNKFFVEQLKLGPKDKRPGAPDVPVKFGLSLLQDSSGNIEMDLPIRGRLDDPDFRIGGIVFKAITGLFFKTLASPFSLIGSIFGGSDDETDFVVFEPGRHDLDQGAKTKLDTVAKAMAQRTRIKLEVDGVTDPITDKSGLIEVIFENKLKQQKYNALPRARRAETSVDDMVVSPEEYGEILYEAYSDEPDEEGIKPTTLFTTDRQPIEFMEKFIIDRIKVTDDDLNELARRRAASVKTHITAADPALTQRIFLRDTNSHRKSRTGVPKHRADLGIK